MESVEHPFEELPAALVEELLEKAETISQDLLAVFEQSREHRLRWREGLEVAGLVCLDAELDSTPAPSTCGIDGSCAVERLLARDLVAAAAVAVEGLTPFPAETQHWPSPHHLVWVDTDVHDTELMSVLRALMLGMELELAVQAPHEIVFLDGSLTTHLITFNQAMNKILNVSHLNLNTAKYFLERFPSFLEAYRVVLTSTETNRCWVGVPKSTTRREIGQAMGWPEQHSDRSLLSFLLGPGEYTAPRPLEQPSNPWHLTGFVEEFISSLSQIQVVYYKPHPCLPAMRLEMNRTVAENPAGLAKVLQGIRSQCITSAMMEPYPLYMADRLVKHLPKAIPAFRQLTTHSIAMAYQGDVSEIILALHSYRTEQ
ncbi:MAG: DNA double-strand break repair nuclease NurA [Nanopusillaceae archaeon]